MVTEYQTVTLYQDRYVPIKPELTAPVEIIQPPEGFDTIALEAARKAQVTQTQVCNMRLYEISQISLTLVGGGGTP